MYLLCGFWFGVDLVMLLAVRFALCLVSFVLVIVWCLVIVVLGCWLLIVLLVVIDSFVVLVFN